MLPAAQPTAKRCCAWFSAEQALRQAAGDARGDHVGSLDVQKVTEVRHDLEDTRVEPPTVLVGRRVIREAVEEEERARVDRAADERVNLAERQRELGAGQPLMRCFHKLDQLQAEQV
jgi:hypothetical protein